MDFDEVADELYALPPGRFTAGRGARVKEARASGDRALAARIAALRRPTVSAWLANRVVREQPRRTEALLQLGSDLRDVQAEPSGEDLRRLSRRRAEMVDALTRDAEELARAEGQTVSATTREELAGTFEAALADPGASAALHAGRLTAALRYSGLGFDGALAAIGGRPSSGPARRARSGSSPRRGASGAAAPERRAAERALAQAGRDAGRAAASCGQAEGALRDVRQRIRQAEALLKELRDEEAATARRVAEARRERATALATERKRQRTVERLGGGAPAPRVSPSGGTGS